MWTTLFCMLAQLSESTTLLITLCLCLWSYKIGTGFHMVVDIHVSRFDIQYGVKLIIKLKINSLD
jgi:hypothetical protein